MSMSDKTTETQLRTASVVDEDEYAVEIARTGPSLVHNLFSASKTVQLHDINNRAAQRILGDLVATIRKLSEVDSRIQLRVVTDFLNINEVRIPVDTQTFGPFRYIMDEMKKRQVEAIEFGCDIEVDEIGRFLQGFFGDVPEDEPYEAMLAMLESSNVTRVQLTQWVEREKHLRETDARRSKNRDVMGESNQVFFRTVSMMGEVLKGIERRRAIQFRKAERLTQQMVDIIQADESILVGLSSIKNFDEYTYAHSVNVCILSMLIGDRLKLHKQDIARLGVATLLHDIGKTYVPQSILNNPGKLEEKDWELMKYHTFFGVVELSRIKALREIDDALFVTLQHHVHYNMNGYPQRANGWKLRVYSRIATVADYFDAMTTARVYQDPVTPDKALRFILEKSGEIFDPFIAKVFIRAMGVYPIGTVVELNTGENAVVIRQNDAGMIHRPVVKILDENMNPADAKKVDLSQVGSDGRFKRSVVKAFYNAETETLKTRFFVNE
jgi:HD-GYP domain-containing protein (c-di-GMP phosphodiesterase class II)